MNNSETCGDCGTLLQGNFCHNCGPLGPFFELFSNFVLVLNKINYGSIINEKSYAKEYG